MSSLLMMAFACALSPLSAFVLLPKPILTFIDRAIWLFGPERRFDVTDEPWWHGDFVVGATYRLRRGAYLYELEKNPRALGPPTRFAPEALNDAQVEFGDARRAPADFGSIKNETRVAEKGLPIEPPVEQRTPDMPLPPRVIDVVQSGTTFRLMRVVAYQAGDRTSIRYRAEVLDGPRKGEVCDISGLSNYGMYGFDTGDGAGYSPNPFMLEKVADPPASRPAPATSPSLHQSRQRI